MCDFISCVELYSGKLRYLTTEDLGTERGRRLSSRDISGHGAVREYFHLEPHEGRDLEFTDFASTEGFPQEIVDVMKAGQFKGVGVAPDALTPKARAEYKRVADPANAEYRRVVREAWAEYKRVTDPARAEYHRVVDEAYAEYRRVIDPANAEYRRVADEARAEYRRVADEALAECHRVIDPANAEYRRVVREARAEYKRVVDEALAEYNRVTDPALAEYWERVNETFWSLWADPENRIECWR